MLGPVRPVAAGYLGFLWQCQKNVNGASEEGGKFRQDLNKVGPRYNVGIMLNGKGGEGCMESEETNINIILKNNDDLYTTTQSNTRVNEKEYVRRLLKYNNVMSTMIDKAQCLCYSEIKLLQKQKNEKATTKP